MQTVTCHQIRYAEAARGVTPETASSFYEMVRAGHPMSYALRLADITLDAAIGLLRATDRRLAQ